MKNILIMAVTLFMLAASMTSQAESGNTKRFVGLWETIDPQDGAHEVVSITKNADGTFKLLLYSTYFTACDGGRGIGQGTGEVAAKRSLKSDDFTITCFETGDIVKLPATFTRNTDGTLTEVNTAALIQPLIYHKTSK